MGIVESKHSSIFHRIRRWWNDDNFDWDNVPANNRSGGLILIWNKVSINNLMCTKAERWLWIQGKLGEKKVHVSILLIYAPNDRRGRMELWDQLRSIKASSSFSLMIMCDVNEVLLPEDRKGHSTVTANMEDFRFWVNDMELIDLPLLGRKYTCMV